MIEKLRARGFKGIKRGLGIDEIEIDFTGRNGLIALDGANGRGKTSVLDLLHPFDCLASRDGALYTHCFLRNSEKELSFTYNGHQYRTLIKIDSESGRSEGYAWIDHAEASVVKGKISEYHKWAVNEFGSPELFFASIFCAQNSKKISDMTVGTLKSLFVEFLRLERYEAWSDTAKQAANIIEGKVSQVDIRIASLQEQVGNKECLELAYCDAGGKAEMLRDQRTVLEHDLVEKRTAVDGLKEVISKNALFMERKKDIQAQIDRLTSEFTKEKEAAEVEINALADKYRGIKAEIDKATAILKERFNIEYAADQVRDLEGSLIILQGAIDEAEKERAAATEKAHGIEKDITAFKAQAKNLETDPENLRLGKLIDEAERTVKEKEYEIRALDGNRELTAIESQMQTAKTLAHALDVKDPDCKSSTCSFIVGAISAADSMIPLGKRRAEIEGEIEAEKADLLLAIDLLKIHAENALADKSRIIEDIKLWNADLAKEIAASGHSLRNQQQVIQSNAGLITTKRQTMATARLEIAKQKELATRLPEVQVAEARKTDLEKQLAEVTEQGTAKKDKWASLECAMLTRKAGYEISIKELAIDETAEPSLSKVQKDIHQIETVTLPGIDKQIQEARERVAAIRAEMSKIEAAEKELAEVRADQERLSVEASRWRYLQQACGKNGLQALEIDGAAPLISARANELLYMGYGPQYSIRIDTQDEEGREDLDIKVLSEWGEDSLKQKSGGEKIWLLHPIRLAMTLLSKEKSGREWDVVFQDELDGPLDGKGASVNFMQMLRPFMEIGNFKQLFYISHKSECLSYADHILSFDKGRGGPTWNGL